MLPLPPRLRLALLGTAAFCAVIFSPAPAADTIDLAGTWRFQLDRQNTGATDQWFAHALSATIPLPGTLPGNNIGDPVTVDTAWTGDIFDKSYYTAPEYAPYRQAGNIKFPFWLQPDTHYVGAAWFQRDLEIPAAWAGRHIELTLERPHWKTTVWLDNHEIGSNDSLSVAHEYDLGPSLATGHHVLSIRVDNTLDPDIGRNSHSVTDHTQGNWNGLVGRLVLTATAPVWIDTLEIHPRISDRVAVVRGHISHAGTSALPAKISLTGGVSGHRVRPALEVAVAANGDFSAGYPLGADAPLWDEFNPVLHQITARIDHGDQRSTQFGLREFTVEGRQLGLNHRKIFLRGTLDCAAYPRTGHPPMDVAAWRKTFGIIQAHGLNHVRFHSWCPPEAAFVAADEMGLYLQIEVSTWPNWSTSLGDGKPVEGWINRETDRILRAYGNHPSFALLSAGNEPGGDHHAAWLSAWVSRQKSRDIRRLYTAGSGWPEVPENDYHLPSAPRIQHWKEGLDSRINHLPPETKTDYREFIGARQVPVVSHEIGQWCAYPNFAEMPKYTGYLKPHNFEIFQASLAAHHLTGQAHDFLIASGKLQALCYKEDIESALRTPEMGGFQLLGLSDFPGQGTALVGVLDAFWEEKGYISPAEFRRFSGPTVPLARLERRVFTTAENFVADLEVAHFGAAPLSQRIASWELVGDKGQLVASGKFAARDIPVGGGNPLGRVDVALRNVPAPARYNLRVSIAGVPAANDWDNWVYPAPEIDAKAPAGVRIVHELDAAAQASLIAGDTLLWIVAKDHVRPDAQKGPIALGFSSIFWNTAWTNGQAPHTLGILCNPLHPAFAAFPTDAYSNWQWWYPITHAGAMILDDLPEGLHPIIQLVDDWFTNRRLGLAFEARVGKGRLLVTSIDLNDGELDPVRRQLRTSLLNYITSPQFRPKVAATLEQVCSVALP